MNDRALQITAAVDELAAELAHADQLIADQQARIELLEQLVAELGAVIAGNEAVA